MKGGTERQEGKNPVSPGKDYSKVRYLRGTSVTSGAVPTRRDEQNFRQE